MQTVPMRNSGGIGLQVTYEIADLLAVKVIKFLVFRTRSLRRKNLRGEFSCMTHLPEFVAGGKGLVVDSPGR